MQAFIRRCDYCGDGFTHLGVSSTLGTFCSDECSLDAARNVNPGRKRVECRVIPELPAAPPPEAR